MQKKVTLRSLDKKIDKVSDTVETLAGAVKRGFDATASKTDVEELKTDVAEVKDRLHRVENILVGGITNRVEDLEDDVRILKTRAGIR